MEKKKRHKNLGLYGATGYNNAVKLLNEACSSLYGNSSKGITARSINMEDIESVLNYDPTTYVNTDVNVKYGQQYSSEYTSKKRYPKIYAEEKESVITPAPEGKAKTLGKSDYKKEEWISGYDTAGTSIQPYQTYYNLSNSDFSNKLKTAQNGATYSSLLLPNTSSTQYWVASHCVLLDSSYCSFSVRLVGSGNLSSISMFYSNGNEGIYNSRPLFPVVSLAASLLEGDATTGFSVK